MEGQVLRGVLQSAAKRHKTLHLLGRSKYVLSAMPDTVTVCYSTISTSNMQVEVGHLQSLSLPPPGYQWSCVASPPKKRKYEASSQTNYILRDKHVTNLKRF